MTTLLRDRVFAAASAAVAVAVVVGSQRGAIGLALVIAVAAPVARLVAERPSNGVLVLAAGLPYHGLLQILPVPGIVDAWPLAVVLGMFGASVLGARRADAPGSVLGRDRSLPGWLLAYVGLAVVTILGVGQVSQGQLVFGIRTMFFPVLVGVVLLRNPLGAVGRDRLVSILMFNGVVTALVGLAQQAMGHEALRELGYRYNRNIRFSGSFLRSFSTFNQPFAFGFFLVVVLVLGLAVALSDTRRARNQAFLLCVPVIGLGLLSSIVRSAWIAAALGILYVGFRRHRVLLLAIPFGVVALLVVPAGDSTNITSSSSANERTSSWVENLPVLYDNPLGMGIGNVGAAAGALNRSEGGPSGFQQGGIDAEDGRAYQPDNQYFKVALELGFAGLYLFVMALASIFLIGRKVGTRAGPDGAWGDAASGYVLGLSVACISTMVFELPATEFLIFAVAGVVTALSVEHESEPTAEVVSR